LGFYERILGLTVNSDASNHRGMVTNAKTRTSNAVELLVALGADAIEHPGGTLLAHLKRVRDLLESWSAHPALRLAGLCHACYGTDGFDTALLPLDRRAELASVIGVDAERLVYFYGSCDRNASYTGLTETDGIVVDRFFGNEFTPTRRQRRDFAELTAANEIDVLRHSPELRRKFGPELRTLLTRFRPLLSEPAWRECRSLPLATNE
jgi:hypothetical protein